MLSIIRSYLTKHFRISPDEHGNLAIYRISDIRTDTQLVYPINFINEISAIFGLSEDEVKRCTNTWSNT